MPREILDPKNIHASIQKIVSRISLGMTIPWLKITYFDE